MQKSESITERSLRHSLKDAGAYATMLGAGETYLSAFALYLKATTPQIGLLVSLPAFLASFVQLFSAWLGRRTGLRKPIILAGASLQAAMWLPIASLPLLFPDAAVPLLIVAVMFYQCGAHLATPLWGSLMGDIVPERRRGRFFAQRTQIVSLATFLSLIVAGGVLDVFARRGNTAAGFVFIFAVAMLARAVSVFHLAKMHEPAGEAVTMQAAASEHWLRRLRQSNFVRFSLFFALMQFSVSLSSPFFSVYMLRDLEFSYAHFMVNTGMSMLAQFLTLNRWGRISDVFGNRRILAATGLLLPLMPLLWVFSTNFWYLLVVQALSGLSWAGFTLSASNFLYDLIARKDRARYLAAHNILASTGLFAGALVGGYLGTVLPMRFDLPWFSLAWASSLPVLFAISAAARTVVLLVLLPKIREVRRVRPVSFTNLIFRVTRAHALAGLVFDIIGPGPSPTARPEDRTD